MKDKIVRVIGVVVIIIFSGYLVWSHFRSEKIATIFCKEQCNYDIEEKSWNLDLEQYLSDEGLDSGMDTKKSFGEKDLDECIDYCKELGESIAEESSR